MNRNRLFSSAVVISTAICCGSDPASAQLSVVATTPDIAAIAKEVGGKAVDVTVLARPTEDPHFVDAKPSFIVKLNHADVLLEGGAELEIGWLPALLEQARNEKLAPGAKGHVACAQAVTLLGVPATLDRSRGDVHAAGNPHYLTDPLNAKKVAALIGESLCAVDPASCDSYHAGATGFGERIDAQMVGWTRALAPFRGTHVVAYHDSWVYFARRFGLEIDLFLEPKPGIPPTPAHLAEIEASMKSQHLRAILVEPYENRKTAEAVADATGATVIDAAQFPGGMKRAEDGYIGLIDALVASLANALSAKPEGGRS